MGKRCCGNCTYAERLRSRWLRVILSRWPGLLICFHKARADDKKRPYCAQYGLETIVLKRLPKPGLPRRESTHLRGF